MKTITIGFSKHRGFAPGSVLIRYVTGKPFSHTYFKFKEDLFQDHTIFHAVGKGLIYISELTFLSMNIPVKEFNLQITDEISDIILTLCHNNAGKKYGFWQNIGIALVDKLNKIGFNIKKNPLNDGINCSEWIYYILKSIDGNWIDKDPNLVEPSDAYNYLMKKENGSIN